MQGDGAFAQFVLGSGIADHEKGCFAVRAAISDAEVAQLRAGFPEGCQVPGMTAKLTVLESSCACGVRRFSPGWCSAVVETK